MAPIILVLSLNGQSVPADYRAYFSAGQAAAAGRPAETISALEPIWKFKPVSPLGPNAAVLTAKCYLELGQPQQALSLLQQYADGLPQPAGSLLLGKAAEAGGAPAVAAGAFQKVFYEYPESPEAEDAALGIARLTARNADQVPPVMPQSVFDRAEKLRKRGQSVQAKRELLAAVNNFGGVDRDLALVRAYTGDYRGLSTAKVSHPEADAERLYLMHAVSRRNSQTQQAESALEELERLHPNSPWTMEALISWGNHHLLRNSTDDFEKFYRTCAERFGSDPKSSYCHWKLTWSAWMRRSPDARQRMETHLKLYPDSEKASAALYFLGRHQTLQQQYPLSFYATLTRPKTLSPTRATTAPTEQFKPSSTMRLRAERAKQLERAGYPDWAEFELRFAAREQPFVAAMELADLISSRGAHDQALRYIKSLAKGYLLMPLESAPQRFWKLAFPFPYSTEVMRNSRARDLDPNLVAALIRQESEFNPRAISRAKAYGLTQVLPSTGRQLSRRVGLPRFRPSMLFQPDVNLKLGTFYLRSLFDSNGGRWETTLAAYNAGQSRVREWLNWYDYKEPAEFIETIPFTETRNYVQIVLRNAEVYRRVYGESGIGARAGN